MAAQNISAVQLQETLLVPPVPEVERGTVLPIDCFELSSADGTAGKTKIQLAYPAGNNVVLRTLAITTADNQITDEEVFLFTKHGSNNVTAVKFSPSGAYICSGDSSGKIRVWGTKGERLQKCEYQLFGAKIMDIAWCPDSQRLAVSGGGPNQAVCILMESGNTVGAINNHSKRINTIAYKPTRPYKIITGGEDFQVALSKGPPFAFEKSQPSLHTNFVNGVRYAPVKEGDTGSYAVSCGSDSKAIVFDGKTLEVVTEIAKGTGFNKCSLYGVEWLNENSFVTICGDKSLWLVTLAMADGVVEVKEKESFSLGKAVEEMPLGLATTKTTTLGTQTLNGGKKNFAFVLSLDGAVKVFSIDVASSIAGQQKLTKPIGILKGVVNSVTAVVCARGCGSNPAASFYYISDVAGNICKINSETRIVEKQINLKTPAISLSLLVNGGGINTNNPILLAICKDQTVKAFDAASLEPVAGASGSSVDFKQIGFAVKVEGEKILHAGDTAPAQTINKILVLTKQKQFSVVELNSPAGSLSLHPAVKLPNYSSDNGAEISAAAVYSSYLFCAFTVQGKFDQKKSMIAIFSSSTAGGTSAPGSLLYEFDYNESGGSKNGLVTALTVSGKSSSSSSTVGRQGISSAVDGEIFLAVGDDAKAIRIFELDLNNLHQQAKLVDITKDWTGMHTAKITALEFFFAANPMNKIYLCSGSLDRSLAVWDVEKIHPVEQIREVHKEGITDLIADSARQVVVTVGADGCLREFRVGS
ncbi:unnamed protein product [Amoebophrya sp. A120]|nr:unnamed protein product [Amoebophrya sp. A120]|eukprot:GSA120T00014432001.1